MRLRKQFLLLPPNGASSGAAGTPASGTTTTIAGLKALSVASGLNGRAVLVSGYYAAGDGGGGQFVYDSSSAAADNAGTIIAPTVGSGRWLRVYSGAVSVRWFGAKGDATANDTTPIQSAVTLATVNNSSVFIPACVPGSYYKITAPIAFTAPVSVLGEDMLCSLIIGVGFSAGQYMFDFNLSAGANYFWRLENFALRSLDGVPRGIHLKNTSYVNMKNVYLQKCKYGIVFEGTTAFSNRFENVVCYQTVSSGFYFLGFQGGGQLTFDHCTFDGDLGFQGDSASAISGASFVDCNFEGCVSNSLVWYGDALGFKFAGGRTEGCTGSVDFIFDPASGKEVSGLSICGMVFSANSAACTAIQLGGSGGQVRGFNISGNDADNSSVAQFITLNGDGESGVVTGNKFRQSATVPVSSQRPGVVVFANENASGKCAEYWGSAAWGVVEYNWTPTDQSGAALSFASAAGYATKVGRVVFWQAVVTYPTTASGAVAKIGGLPSNPTVGGSTQGRAGARVDMSNSTLPIACYQGTPDTNKIQLVNAQSLVDITNVQLTGKTLYLSGQYTV